MELPILEPAPVVTEHAGASATCLTTSASFGIFSTI